MRTSDGTWRATDTTNSLFQLATDDGAVTYPDLLLVNVPRTWAAGPAGRFGKDETRFDSGSQSKNGYAHTATRFTVIAQSPDADCDLIGAVAAILTNQGITSDVRQSTPTPSTSPAGWTPPTPTTAAPRRAPRTLPMPPKTRTPRRRRRPACSQGALTPTRRR